MEWPDRVPPGALHAPHTLRNRGPILAVLARALGTARAVLEVACGSGEQAPFFAEHLPHLMWLASDPDADAVASAAAWARAAANPRLLTPVRLDVTERPWALPAGFVPDAVVCINMIHIAPFAACEALIGEAGARLPAGGVVYLYGPYRVGGAHTADSNAAFDRSLKARNPDWGIRDLETVIALAERSGLKHEETVEMPANNLSLVLRCA